jgi:hypothetical protein
LQPALGVQSRGGDRMSDKAKTNVENSTMVPSQVKHAENIGVHRDTVAKWERDRKEIKSDPELAAKATTPEGYQEAKKVIKKRRATQAEAVSLNNDKMTSERAVRAAVLTCESQPSLNSCPWQRMTPNSTTQAV